MYVHLKSPEKICQIHLTCFETVPNSNFFPSGVYVRHVRTFNFTIPFLETFGYSRQISKTAREGWILPVQIAGLPRLLRHTALLDFFFFESLMKSLFQSSKKVVKTFCQLEQCNFSTSKIEREERFQFVGKTGEIFRQIWNSTLPQTDRVITHSPSLSIDQGAWHKYDRANGTVIFQ